MISRSKMAAAMLGAVAALAASGASATTVSCTVTGGTVLLPALGGLGYAIFNGTGTSSGGATGTISCPAVTTGVGVIDSWQVLATADYAGGPFGTVSGTTVQQTLSLVGGALNGASQTVSIFGGNSSTSSSLGTPFQIGSTLGGATSYPAFTVNVASLVTAGGPVTVSTGQVVINYSVSAVPEPASVASMLGGLALMGLYLRRRTRN